MGGLDLLFASVQDDSVVERLGGPDAGDAHLVQLGPDQRDQTGAFSGQQKPDRADRLKAEPSSDPAGAQVIQDHR